MGCGCHEESCCSQSKKNHCSSCCGCECHEQVCHEEENECCDKAEKLLEIADLAWVEVLKEKIKEQIKQNDPKLDELAKIVAEANHKRWKHKMDRAKCENSFDECCEEYEEKLHNLFSCDSGSCNIKK